MRKIFSITLLLFSVQLSAQLSAQWQQMYGSSAVEIGYGVKSCLDQGYIVVGSSSGAGPSDGYIVRTDSMGLVIWSRFYGGSNIDVIRAVELLPDSGFIMTGFTNSFGNGGYDGWILRTDKNGDTLWTKTTGTGNWDFFYDVAVTFDSGFVFVGGTYGASNGDQDLWMIKTDSSGNVLWDSTWGGAFFDEGRAVIELSDSMIVACGYTHSMGDSLGDSWILKVDYVTGDTIWTRTLGHPNYTDKALGLSRWTIFDAFLIAGETHYNGDPDAYIMSMTNDSVVNWNFNFGGVGSDDYFNCCVAHPNGAFCAMGYSSNPLGGGNGDYYLHTTRNGWFSSLVGTFSPETCQAMDLAHDDGYIACGSTEGFGAYQGNMHLIKLDTNALTTTVVSIQEPTYANSNGISSVFPNPSSGSAVITLNVYQTLSDNLHLTLYDCMGNIVRELSSDDWTITDSRNALCELNVSGLSAGIYSYNIFDDSGWKCGGRIIVAH
jgi:hypothetical protein